MVIVNQQQLFIVTTSKKNVNNFSTEQVNFSFILKWSTCRTKTQFHHHTYFTLKLKRDVVTLETIQKKEILFVSASK